MPEAHVFHLRVYYEDTDAGGVVYYANYLRFAERARAEYLRSVGTDNQTLMAKGGIAFTVRQCVVDYMQPAYLDDTLTVHTRFLEVGGASLRAEQTVKRDADDLARLLVRLACVGNDGKPKRMPKALRAAFTEKLVSPKNEQITAERN
jgi:acyl-CoA thioester hydrolase